MVKLHPCYEDLASKEHPRLAVYLDSTLWTHLVRETDRRMNPAVAKAPRNG
jgi:hypothetical protein